MFKLKDLKFYFITTCPQTDRESDIYNHAWKLFKDVWQPIFKNKFSSDSFVRQRRMVVITYKGEAIGICSHSFFDLKSLAHTSHNYFSDYPDYFFDVCKDRGLDKLITFESLTVHPKYRGPVDGVTISNLLTYLSYKATLEYSYDYIVAPVVKTNKASSLGLKSGTEVLCSDVNYKGLLCDILMINKHEIKQVSHIPFQKVLDHLWKNRIDLTKTTSKGEDLKDVA
jgi:hypothetical protein